MSPVLLRQKEVGALLLAIRTVNTLLSGYTLYLHGPV